MFNSIVVGTDGSDTALHAVDEAIDLAKSVGAKVQLVTAHREPRPHSTLRRVPSQAQLEAAARQEDGSGLEDAAARVERAGLEVEAHVRRGDPASVILDVAEQTGADLIVVGNRGMTGATRFLLGSVPNKVSHSASCSVLIVRTT
jgi:nucleotide-binding universal stress UspA family protein